MDHTIHTRRDTLSKSERLCSERRIEALFADGRRGGAGPLRFRWAVRSGCDTDGGKDGGAAGDAAAKGTPEVAASADTPTGGRASGRVDLRNMGDLRDAGDAAAVSVLFSVPKKVFKRAWRRNLMKRRMRESYRRRKHELVELALSLGLRVDIALICMPEGAIKGKDKGSAAKAAKAAKISATGGATSGGAAITKKSGARKTQEAPLPDFKTIDDAIEKTLAQIAARLRR